MKNFTLSLFICFITSSLFAQDVRLNDSVIFINDKPVALYSKTISNSTPRYNMEVYSFDDYILIKAEVIEFAAPVAQLRPFYYYELTFPPTADTFAMYIEDEAFPLVLAKIIRDYNLIDKNELNKKSVARFIDQHPGGPALTSKINSFKDYLNETRYFNEQVKRDRTKPVTIINNRIIMQDGVKIGLIAAYENTSVSRQPNENVPPVYDSSRIGITRRAVFEDVINTTTETQILLYNSNRRIDDNLSYNKNWSGAESPGKAAKQHADSKRSLYQVSKAAIKKNAIYSDYLLMKVCYLIEDYAL